MAASSGFVVAHPMRLISQNIVDGFGLYQRSTLGPESFVNYPQNIEFYFTLKFLFSDYSVSSLYNRAMWGIPKSPIRAKFVIPEPIKKTIFVDCPEEYTKMFWYVDQGGKPPVRWF